MEYSKLMEELNSKTHRMSFYPLCKFMESPRAFIKYRTKERPPMTDDMKLGQLFENLVLRDEKGDFVIFDDSEKIKELDSYKNPRATKDYKEWKLTELSGINPDLIVSQDLYDVADAMRNRLWNHNYWKYYLSDKIRETDKEVNWEANGVKFKGYLDALGDFVLDLKKINDASFRKAKYTIRDRN